MTRFCEVALQLFRTKSSNHLIAEVAAPEQQMKRTLSLTAGNGVTIFIVRSLLKLCMIALSVCKPIAKTHSLLTLSAKTECVRAVCLE
jgi:hypothetical protein